LRLCAFALKKRVFSVDSENEIWLLTIYSKSKVENIPAHILHQIAKEIENV